MERDTVAVYESQSAAWRDRRPARFVDRARALADAIPEHAIRIDLGCGAGKHLPILGSPVVALDAAYAMVDLARHEARDAWPVQADLEALPFRRGSLAGAWARASYLHVPRDRLPWALAQLHRALALDAPIALVMQPGDHEGERANDDEFPGRYFASWPPDALVDVVSGAGFTIQECSVDGPEWVHVRATRARTLPDVVGPGMRMLVVGLNPSLYAADAGVGFARPGNRFWPAARAAGIVSRDRDPEHALLHHAVGMTDLVKRATVGARELTAAEYREGLGRVERLVRWLRPGVVCFAGLAGWRTVVDRTASTGYQPGGFAGVPAYVMPNPSGLNAHTNVVALAAHLRAALDGT
jgi:TDG/mug DNA glycosylase family protein